MRPPLTARLRRSHWIALDCLAALVAALVLASSAWAAHHQAAHSLPGLLPVILLAMLGAAPVALRRIRPLPAFCAVLVLYLVLGAMQQIEGVVMAFPTAYVLYLVAVTYRRRVSASALASALAADGVLTVRGGTANSALIPVGLMLIVFWTLGTMARQRRAYASGLQQQAASQAVAEERLRIARELHDVVAHSMAVIAVQAGFGQYVIDSQPGQAREALGAIQATSRDTLDEMRRMLSVLRQADTLAALDAAEVTGAAGGSGEPGGPGRPSSRPQDARRRPAGPGSAHHPGRARRGPRRPAGRRAAGGRSGQRGPVRLPHHPGGADQRGQARRHPGLPGPAGLPRTGAEPGGAGRGRRGPGRGRGRGRPEHRARADRHARAGAPVRR